MSEATEEDVEIARYLAWLKLQENQGDKVILPMDPVTGLLLILAGLLCYAIVRGTIWRG